jgi:hypothetical protein
MRKKQEIKKLGKIFKNLNTMARKPEKRGCWPRNGKIILKILKKLQIENKNGSKNNNKKNRKKTRLDRHRKRNNNSPNKILFSPRNAR